MRYEIVVTALILAAAIITLCMINRPDYEPVSVAEPLLVIADSVEVLDDAGDTTWVLQADPTELVFYDLGDGAVVIWASDACPEPMIVSEFCFSPAAGKLYVGVGSMRMPISTESLVEYWEKYHR
jgi:hypothetical protein